MGKSLLTGIKTHFTTGIYYPYTSHLLLFPGPGQFPVCPGFSFPFIFLLGPFITNNPTSSGKCSFILKSVEKRFMKFYLTEALRKTVLGFT